VVGDAANPLARQGGAAAGGKLEQPQLGGNSQIGKGEAIAH
jgi:hypothetical protein